MFRILIFWKGNMKKYDWILAIALTVIAASLIAYKTLIVGLPFIPKDSKNIWNIEIAVRTQPSTKSRKIGFPIPRQSDRISVLSSQYDGKGMSLTIEKTPYGIRGYWLGKSPEKRTVFYRTVVQIDEKHYRIPSDIILPKNDQRFKEYLNTDYLDGNDLEAIKKIEKEILVETMNTFKSLKEIFYFVFEEVLINSKRQWNNLYEIAEHLEADSLGKARLFNALARRQGIPTRIVGGLILKPEKRINEKGNYEISYWNEINIEGKWIPVCANYGNFAYLSDEYLPLFWNIEDISTLVNDDRSTIRFAAHQIDSAHFTIQKYRKEIQKSHSWIVNYSLYFLPINVQSVFKILVLIPFGAIVLVVFRNIIGLKTFGIFMPVLLALFFQEIGLGSGIMFFATIVAVGFLLRYFLKKMQLLAVPHLSIILTVVVILLCVFAIFNRNITLFREFTPSLFPIVITTIFIERLGLMIEEEGFQNTVYALLGTMVIAIISHILFSIRTLQTIVFTHPEILLSLISVFIILGKYTGYRLTELIRFREFLKKE